MESEESLYDLRWTVKLPHGPYFSITYQEQADIKVPASRQPVQVDFCLDSKYSNGLELTIIDYQFLFLSRNKLLPIIPISAHYYQFTCFYATSFAYTSVTSHVYVNKIERQFLEAMSRDRVSA